MTPTCSLLVPCYNAARFVARLRDQVRRLEPAFREILLADDRSTDNTVELAESAGFKVLRLGVNRGPGAARNALARAANADWIHFHDIDDELAPNYLLRVRSEMMSGKDVIFHFVDFIDEQTRAFVMRWDFSEDLVADPSAKLLSAPMVSTSSVIRRDFFLRHGGYREQYRCFEDGDLHFRLALAGARVGAVREVLEISLRHGEGASADQHCCAKCRLGFLEEYLRMVPERLYPVLARECERTAVQLLRFRDNASADRAIALATSLGLELPHTHNKWLRMCARALPSRPLLKIQDNYRTWRANAFHSSYKS
jgi:glycosyltransferase involved in cell wall biosynthesis